MTCREVVSRLNEYIEGSLPSGSQGQIEDHLCECADCLAYVSTLAAVPAVLKAASSDAHRTPAPLPEWLVRVTISRSRTVKWLDSFGTRRMSELN